MKADKKIIFFDIDGTLISEKTNLIPKGTVQAIKRARENGHLAFINTGRTFFNVTENVRNIGFDGYVCGCGTYIHYKGKSILERSIPHETCVDIVKKLREYKMNGILEGLNAVYFDNTRPAAGDLAKIKTQFSKQGFDVTRSWDEADIVFDKFVFWVDEDSDFEAFFSYFKNNFEFIDRSNGFWEVLPKGYSKATGIKFLQEYLNIPLESCFAIGDSTNDLAMLEYVPNSIAMGNSTPSILDRVSYVTKDIDDDGIEHALSYYNII